jgi:hypothetical protein
MLECVGLVKAMVMNCSRSTPLSRSLTLLCFLAVPSRVCARGRSGTLTNGSIQTQKIMSAIMYILGHQQRDVSEWAKCKKLITHQLFKEMKMIDIRSKLKVHKVCAWDCVRLYACMCTHVHPSLSVVCECVWVSFYR